MARFDVWPELSVVWAVTVPEVLLGITVGGQRNVPSESELWSIAPGQHAAEGDGQPGGVLIRITHRAGERDEIGPSLPSEVANCTPP